MRMAAKLLLICCCPHGTRKKGINVPKIDINNNLFQLWNPDGNLDFLTKVRINKATQAKSILTLITVRGETLLSAIFMAPNDDPQRAPSEKSIR